MLALHRRTLLLFLGLSLGHLLLISAQVQSNNGLPVVEAVAFGVFARVQQITASGADAVRSLWSNYVALHGVQRDNDDLRRRVLELEAQVQQQQAAASERQGLEAALALERTLPARTLAARVIAGDPSPGSLTITIDRGTADGIAPDMAVIAARGVVGRVINRPAAHAAQVQLLTGRNAAAGALLERTGAGGIVVGGAANPPLAMNYVSNLADVRPGDRVVTSGQDGIFPRGFLIGTVERADRGSGLYREIVVRPAVDYSHIDIVLVMLARPAKAGGGGL
jgi:rod shape-determining protein MreC